MALEISQKYLESYEPDQNSLENIALVIDILKRGKPKISYNNEEIQVLRKLGAGGTKTVVDAVIDGKPFAIALPNTVDRTHIALEKWKVALQEPQNTQIVRDLGLLANPIYEVMDALVNEIPFPIFKIARYQDLPFRIMDGKNPSSSTVNEKILPDNLDLETLESYLANFLPDIQVMIQNGVRVGKDSVNICIQDDLPRIFLLDLGDADFESFDDNEVANVTTKYISFACTAFINGLPNDEYYENEAIFKDAFDYDNESNIITELTTRLLGDL